MKKFLLLLWNKIFEHLVGVVIGALFTTSFFLEVFTKIKPLTKLVIPFVMWRWSGWIALVVVVATLLIRDKVVKSRVKRQDKIKSPPKYHASFDRKVDEREFGGVVWKILVGTNVKPSNTELTRESVFAWPYPRAYCPECDYELERKGANWFCMPCRKNYKIPKNLQENTWEKVRRNYERLVVQWGYNNFGIAEDDHRPFRVVIRELKKKREGKNKG